MEESKAELFAFRWRLYNISNKLTRSDLEKMKFMLSDFLPRQQLEKARSGFDLLCLMASREDVLSPGNYSFLEDLLREVGKSDYIKSTSSSGTLLSLSSSMTLRVGLSQKHPKPKLLQVKKLLGEICDNLSTENVHDLCQFFAGICESINYQNLHDIVSAEQLFSRLQESSLIGMGNLQPLQQVLILIGRKDLASRIEAFNAQSLSSPTPEKGHNIICLGTSEEHSSGVSPSIPTPEEESNHEGTRVFAGCSLSSRGSSQFDTLPDLETDSGHNTQQLIFKIEDRERKLEAQEAELITLHKKLLEKKEFEYQDQQEKLLRMALEKKTDEVKHLQESLMKLQELFWKKDDVPLYVMNQKPHGVAVVIVNQTFHANSSSTFNVCLKARKGAVQDTECFLQTFSQLDYTVRVYSDMSAAEMQSLIVAMGALDHSDYDSFVCCVSSHGNQDGIYGSDSVVLDRKEFIDPIKSCTSLAGKPKMFFFQACRVPQVSADSPETFRPAQSTTLHCDADILIANASTQGSPAYTSPETGSWFANALRLKLTHAQLVYVRTLQQILEEVTDLVSQAAGQLPNGERVNQCVEVTTRMRKGVKFFN